MADRRSAGILLFRRAGGTDGGLEVLLGHMGGPFWARRDAGAWSVIKG
ncbi:DNA mismatch repair protein MutT, partial [Streptomyces sp. SID4948]|nr:DNA mismatch repair protein MutT [Streptomyces sp. SID4948]